jgi:putative ABC transport system permease protein
MQPDRLRDWAAARAAEGLVRDFAYAFRTLRRSPVFTIVAVVTLALGIGSTTAMFSVAGAVLMRGLPYRNADRLTTVYEASEDGHLRTPSFPTFDDWQRQSTGETRAIAGLAFVRGDGFTLPGPDGPDQFISAYVSPGYFALMGTPPMLGRTFRADEEKPGAAAVAVVSYNFFIDRCGANASVLGTVLDVDSVPTTIIGVMPKGFAFPNFSGPTWLPPSLWEPINVFAARHNALALRGLHVDSRVVLRLAAGADSAGAVVALRTIERRLEAAYPREQAHWTSVILQPVGDELFGSVRPALVLLSVAIGLVLLLACANVTNLLVARASARAREIAVRTALGATRWRIVRQLMIETIVLAIAAGSAGVALSAVLLGGTRRASGGLIPFASELRVDRTVALFAAAITLGTTLVIGLAPALRASGGRIEERLRRGTSGAVGGAGERRLRSALVSVQFAFALTLLIAAGLLLQSFRRLESVPLGYDPENLISFTIAPASSKYARPEQAAALYQRILDATRSLPGVEFTAATGGALLPTDVEIDGWPAGRPPPQALYHPASADYLRAMRIPMKAGRWFTGEDMRSAAGFVINARLAKMLVPGGDAIGRRITIHRSSQARADFGQPITLPVIGIVADIHEFDRARTPDPEVYLPYTLEVWPWMNFVVRVPNAGRRLPEIVRAVQDVDPAIRFRGKPSVEAHSFAGLVAPPFLTMVLSGFAACALLLAAVGLYGIVAYGVAQRSREIGIRIALGASMRDVVSLVLREGVAFVLVGAAGGLAGALASSRLLETMLFDTKRTDAETFGAVLVVLMLVTVAATYLPAARAARVDPMTAIRID